MSTLSSCFFDGEVNTQSDIMCLVLCAPPWTAGLARWPSFACLSVCLQLSSKHDKQKSSNLNVHL